MHYNSQIKAFYLKTHCSFLTKSVEFNYQNYHNYLPRVFIGAPSEISKFGLFRQFCVQEFIADLELHELALQRGIPGILQCVMTEAEF